MICCTPWEEKACAKVCESNRMPFPVRPEISWYKFLEFSRNFLCMLKGTVIQNVRMKYNFISGPESLNKSCSQLYFEAWKSEHEKRNLISSMTKGMLTFAW